MKLLWTPEAEQDRDSIWEFIAASSPAAAARMDQLFTEAIQRLQEFPMLGQAGRIPGTREWIPHDSYRVLYEIDEDEEILWILALVHTARRWPPV